MVDRRLLRPLLLAVACLIEARLLAGDAADFVGVDPTTFGGADVAAACTAAGCTPRSASADATAFGRILVWSVQTGADLTPARASTLSAYVAGGGRLLIMPAPQRPQLPATGMIRLQDVLPGSAWRMLLGHTQWPYAGTLAWVDAETGLGAVPAATCDEYVPVPPEWVPERGEARAWRWSRPVQLIDLTLPAGSEWWTRQIASRGWRPLARVGDAVDAIVASGGLYGSGRIVLCGFDCTRMSGAQAERQAFWRGMVAWLQRSESALQPPPTTLSPTIAIDEAARRVRVTLPNPGAAAGVEVVGRILAWDGSWVGDVRQRLALPAAGSATCDIVIPAVTAASPQTLVYRDAYRVRIGVLGAGATPLDERSVMVDLQPRVRLELELDDEGVRPWPWTAQQAARRFPEVERRMGRRLMSYGYAPGGALQATVRAVNGLRNIAPLATVADEGDPTNYSLAALTDAVTVGEKWGDTDSFTSTGGWFGAANVENVLRFTWSSPVTVSAVTLFGAGLNYRLYEWSNPGAAIIECDGVQVAQVTTPYQLDDAFLADTGRVRLAFAPRSCTTLRVRLPWVPKLPNTRDRWAPILGEIEVEGSANALPSGALNGTAQLTLQDPLTGAATPAGSVALNAAPGTAASAVATITLPSPTAPTALRLRAQLGALQAEQPLLVVAPRDPVRDVATRLGDHSIGIGFNVTRGFRTLFPEGVGTKDMPGNWGTPDDLAWAYARDLKEIDPNHVSKANRMFATVTDLRHYSNSWRSFPNGESVWALGVQGLLAQLRANAGWAACDVVNLAFGDRWEWFANSYYLGSWRDEIDFDQWLRARGQTPLTPGTRTEIGNQLKARWLEWDAFQKDRHLRDLRGLRQAIEAAGKRLVINEQGASALPGELGAEIARVVVGGQDDSTWGMLREDHVLTAAREMAALAINPGLQMSDILVWHYDSGLLQNAHWHNPLGTTESSRRHRVLRAWRATVRADGSVTSMHRFGYTSNAPNGPDMTGNDWQEAQRAKDRQTLIVPEDPEGWWVALASDDLIAPRVIAGNYASTDTAQAEAMAAIAGWSAAGFSMPCAGSLDAIAASGRAKPILVPYAQWLTDREVDLLAFLARRGCRIALMARSGSPLSARVQEFCGVGADRTPTTGTTVATVKGKPVVARDAVLLVPFDPSELAGPHYLALADALAAHGGATLRFPRGTSGYAFRCQGRLFVALADMREEGRTVPLPVRSAATTLRAVSLDSHLPLTTRRSGDTWTIDAPLRSGDGDLIAIEER